MNDQAEIKRRQSNGQHVDQATRREGKGDSVADTQHSEAAASQTAELLDYALQALRGLPAPEKLSELLGVTLRLNERPERALLDADELAKALCFSVRTIRRMDLEGRLPRPIEFGRYLRWRADEIREWVQAGCPHRDDWEQAKQR